MNREEVTAMLERHLRELRTASVQAVDREDHGALRLLAKQLEVYLRDDEEDDD